MKKNVILAKFEEDAATFAIPLGLLYLASSLRQSGFEATIFHGIGSKKTIDGLVRRVRSENPLMVGFSTLTGTTIRHSLRASQAIKASCDVPVVWGGHHPTITPEQTLAEDSIDYAILGEGEETMRELADCLANGSRGRDIESVKGLAVKDGREIRITPERPFIGDLDVYEPAWDLVDLEDYFKTTGNRELILSTSRGCPFKCGFCYSHIVNKRRFRAHSASHTLDQIERLRKKCHPKSICFADDEFFINKNRALEIIENIDIPWTAYIRIPDLLNLELVKRISSTSCIGLNAGGESGADRILKMIEKGQTVEQIKEAASIVEAHDVRLGLTFVAGFPTETWDETVQTLELMRWLRESFTKVSFQGPKIYTPYPGTPLYELAIEHGFRPPTSLEEWGDYTRYKCNLPYIRNRLRLEALHFYGFAAYKNELGAFRRLSRLFCKLASWRWRRCFFDFPFDFYLIDRLRFARSMVRRLVN